MVSARAVRRAVIRGLFAAAVAVVIALYFLAWWIGALGTILIAMLALRFLALRLEGADQSFLANRDGFYW